MDYKRNRDNKKLKIELTFDKTLKYKTNWIQHIDKCKETLPDL